MFFGCACATTVERLIKARRIKIPEHVQTWKQEVYCPKQRFDVFCFLALPSLPSILLLNYNHHLKRRFVATGAWLDGTLQPLLTFLMEGHKEEESPLLQMPASQFMLAQYVARELTLHGILYQTL